MLSWLDASANRKEHPNENLARELMEFVAAMHDASEKTVLGQKGALNGDGLLELLLKNEATSKRLASRLCEMFFGENVVDDEARSELAEGLRKNGLNIEWGVATILRSRCLPLPC